MKTVFLSMLAIAALASCSKQDFIDPPSPNPQEGEKMLVNITLSSGEITKASGAATTAEDKPINNVTVFFLNATDQIVSRQYVSGTSLTEDPENAGVKQATVETRTTATKMMVIANIGEDRTATGGTLNVATRSQLVNVVQDLVNTDNPPLPVQVKGDVLMSGEGNVSEMVADPTGGASTATAAVTLDYIAAKITLSKIELGASSTGSVWYGFQIHTCFFVECADQISLFPYC